MGSYGGEDEQGSRKIREPLLTEADEDPQVPSLPERDRRRRWALHGAKQGGHRPLPPWLGSPARDGGAQASGGPQFLR